MRDYRMPYNATLLEFHNHICTDLRYDPHVMASFFRSDRQWSKLAEYTLIDMGSEEAAGIMSDIALDQLITQTGDRLIYTFDIFSDRSLYLEMVGVHKPEEGAQYPCTARSVGDPPPQFALEGESSVFDDIMAEFADFEGDESYDEEF